MEQAAAAAICAQSGRGVAVVVDTSDSARQTGWTVSYARGDEHSTTEALINAARCLVRRPTVCLLAAHAPLMSTAECLKLFCAAITET